MKKHFDSLVRIGIQKKEVLLNTGTSFFFRILGACAAFLVSILISRHLGANDAGVYFLAFSIVSFFAAISRLGSDNILLRYTSRKLEGTTVAKDVLLKSLSSTAIFGSILIILFILFADTISNKIFDKPELELTLRAMAPGILGLALLTLISVSFQGLRKFIFSIFLLNLFVNICLAIYIQLFTEVKSDELATIFSLASFLGFIIGGLILRYHFNKQQVFEKLEWNVFIRSSAPMFLIMFMNQLIQWSGQLISGLWVSNSDLAILAVCQRTALLTSFVLTAVNLVVAPKFSELHHQNKISELENLAIFSVKLMTLVSLPLAIVLLVFPSIVLSIFGSEFQNGANILRVIVIGQLINVLTGSVGYLLTMSGHEKDLRNSVILSGVVVLILNIVLIPTLGILGAAISTAIALILQNLLAVHYVKKRLGFNTLNLRRLFNLKSGH